MEITNECEEASTEKSPEKELSPYKKQQMVDNSKDNNLSIFHVLGKFLYNKRWDSREKEGRKMTSKELMDPRLKTRPRFYENHSKLLQQSMLEP